MSAVKAKIIFIRPPSPVPSVPRWSQKWGTLSPQTSCCAAGPCLYVCTKFKADSSIRSKVISGSQNLEIESRDQGHAHLGVL